MTLAQALTQAESLGLARLDAQWLLLHALGREGHERAWLLAHDTDDLTAKATRAFAKLCQRRASGEPLAYIVGHKEFFGLRLSVDQRVLVPRPDTETLVQWALDLLACHRLAPSTPVEPPLVMDLGTGSGAIALAIKRHCPSVRVEAVDASADALEVARANATTLQLDVAFRQASWLDGSAARCQLILSNPPYVAAGDPHLTELTHEPAQALTGGPDGLRDIRTIVEQAPARLLPGGWLLLEHGYDQASAVRDLLAAAGFAHIASRRDLAGIERCSGGQWLELG